MEGLRLIGLIAPAPIECFLCRRFAGDYSEMLLLLLVVGLSRKPIGISNRLAENRDPSPLLLLVGDADPGIEPLPLFDLRGDEGVLFGRIDDCQVAAHVLAAIHRFMPSELLGIEL